LSSIKVLFLASNPKDTNPLALDEEIRQITSKLRTAEYRDSIELTSAWAVRTGDLLQLLNQHMPQIVHFSGHGSESGEIILKNESDESKPVSKRALTALFTTLKDNIKVVVLNCCYSKEQARAIAQVIDCTIGMSDAIGDKAAIIFAASFYRAIGFGRSVKDAFDQGIIALLLEDIPEENTPELLVKDGVDPSQIFLLEGGKIVNLSIKNKTQDIGMSSINSNSEVLKSRLKSLLKQLEIQTENLNVFEIEKAKYAGQMVPRRLEIDIEDTKAEIEKLKHEIEQIK
jgi:hypothetical protein